MMGGGRRDPRRFRVRRRKLFALKRQPPKNQGNDRDDDGRASLKSERMVLDANVLDPSGHTAIDWFEASRDGKRIAVSLSKNGSEDGTLHVFDVATEGDRRADPERAISDGRRQPGLDGGRNGLLLHALSRPRAPTGGSAFQYAGLFPHAGRRMEKRSVVLGQKDAWSRFPRFSSTIASISYSAMVQPRRRWRAFCVLNANGGELAEVADYTDGFREADIRSRWRDLCAFA